MISTIHKPVKDPTLPAIIFVPGYKGSILAQPESGRRVWVDAYEATLGRKSLELPYPGSIDTLPLDLVEAGILRGVDYLPGLFGLDVYGTPLRTLERNFAGTANVIPLSYDWRRDLMVGVKALAAKVAQLRSAGADSISIVAHSMGGLITTYYLRYGTQPIEAAVENWEGARIVRNVVLAGVPFKGSILSFRDLQFGTLTGINTTLLSAKALHSFGSIYQLLPAPGVAPLLSSKLEQLPDWIYDWQAWHKYGWGPLSYAQSKSTNQTHKAYIQGRIHSANRLFELLHRPANPNATFQAQADFTLLNLRGLKRDTLAHCIFEPQTGQLACDPKMLRAKFPTISPKHLMQDGDGTVTTDSSELPQAYLQLTDKVDTIYSEADHTRLLHDWQTMAKVINFLN